MKQNLKYVLKLFLTLLFSAFASFMIAISFAVIFAKSSGWIFYTFTQAFTLILLVALIWQTVYDIGFKDSNMVRTGHRNEDILRGFKVGAAAQIPWLIGLLLSFAFNIRFSFYRIFNSVYWTFLTLASGTVKAEKIAEIKMRDIGAVGITVTFLLLLIVPIVSGAVYILGYKGIDVFSKLVYKKRKEK